MNDSPPKFVTPRPAASLVVVDEAGPAPKVLMGMRGAGHKFMPNRLVFPGGAVDPGDHDAPFATPPRPDVLRRLEKSADPKLALALLLAAARELEEETGLSLGAPPALDGLDYLCRAVTPEGSPMRFDARFLVVDAARVSGQLGGSDELENLAWYALEEATAMDLAIPQRRVLDKLLIWLALSDAERRGMTTVDVLHNRLWVTE
jgi:8-oxo-dGTP pyrophosphatase MutT (NUDIX family)